LIYKNNQSRSPNFTPIRLLHYKPLYNPLSKGRAQLGAAFHLCDGAPVDEDAVAALSDWYTDAIETMPQMNCT
jgi:hypothetical protein